MPDDPLALRKFCLMNQLIRLVEDRKIHNPHVLLINFYFKSTKPEIIKGREECFKNFNTKHKYHLTKLNKERHVTNESIESSHKKVF